MNFLERIPTRWLLAGAALACLVLWTAPIVAQTTPDPVLGEPLFNDTPNVAGVPNSIINSCTNCHTNVQNRRTRIGGSAFADISYETALNRLGSAISSQSAMAQFQALDVDQVAHIAAYIADTPKVTATDLTTANVLAFEASASGVSVTKNLTIRHSVATADNLSITNVALSSGGSTFARSSACNGATRAPAGTCTFSVTYTPTSTAPESRTLTVSLQQGASAFTRTITLQGSVAGVVTPPPASSGDSDSGGGALGAVWLSGLALATALLARRRRA
jgi:hypothetical protein